MPPSNIDGRIGCDGIADLFYVVKRRGRKMITGVDGGMPILAFL